MIISLLLIVVFSFYLGEICLNWREERGAITAEGEWLFPSMYIHTLVCMIFNMYSKSISPKRP